MFHDFAFVPLYEGARSIPGRTTPSPHVSSAPSDTGHTRQPLTLVGACRLSTPRSAPGPHQAGGNLPRRGAKNQHDTKQSMVRRG
eukprot:1652366-Prymnesium_polylepis.1